MKLILCVDPRFGYAFNHRRQSSDREMRRHMLGVLKKLAEAASSPEPCRIFYNAYTEKSLLRDDSIPSGEVLPGETGPVRTGRHFLQEAAEQDAWAYVENVSLEGYHHEIDEILLYTWDKRYPADLLFPEELLESFLPAEEEELPGHSHELIRYCHYIRKEVGQEKCGKGM